MNATVQALGWALVHFIWQGAAIALALAAALPFCRRPTARYGAACLALLSMAVAFAITTAISIPAAAPALPLPNRFPIPAAPAGSVGLVEPSPALLSHIAAALPWIVAVWIAGALVICTYRCGGWLAAERMRRTALIPAHPEWQERLTHLAREIGASRPVRLVESRLAEVPVVIGFLGPIILVPAGLLAGLPPDELESILLHELAHIHRSDYLVNLLQTIVESLLFYHPAVWWVSGIIRAERENCCDDIAVAARGNAHAYAATLVSLEEHRMTSREPALAATGGNLMHRIRRLLNQPEPPRTATALLLSMGFLLGVCCLLAAPQQNPAPQQRPAPQPRIMGQKAQDDSPAELPTRYRKWIDEDVVYIIRPEERAAFEKLQSDPEREHFVKQFWLRRDPTPGTPENEFKEEHYRRIAYANEHFASSKPGWKTDRGRIYIVYGPPDEIEDRSQMTPSTQTWTYRHIEGIGDQVVIEFLDAHNTGDFQMTSDPKSAK
jgi:GWxTD domain-containing protein